MIDINDIFKKLICENNFKYIVVENYELIDDKFFDIFVVTRNSFDYYIYLKIDYYLLGLISNNIQINIATKFKKYLKDNMVDFNVSHFFDKNTYLIIATEVPDIIESKALYKEISSVEEDPYYFKKQVLYYTEQEMRELKNDLIINSHTSYFNSVVANIERYEEYTANFDLEYGLIVRFFEKFPFLKFQVAEKELLSLKQMITNELSKADQEICKELLNFKDDRAIDVWIESLGK